MLSIFKRRRKKKEKAAAAILSSSCFIDLLVTDGRLHMYKNTSKRYGSTVMLDLLCDTHASRGWGV